MGWKDSEQARLYNKQYSESGKWKAWYHSNKARLKVCRAIYFRENRDAILNSKKEWIKRNPWFKNFIAAKQRCKRDGPYKDKGIKFNLTLLEIKNIWFRDKAYDLKSPSIDRKDSKGDYTFENCRFIERLDNCRQGGNKKLFSD